MISPSSMSCSAAVMISAVADIGYLLNDNVEVIAAPPQAPV